MSKDAVGAENLDKVVRLLEAIFEFIPSAGDRDTGAKLDLVIEELKGIKEELVQLNEYMRKIRYSAEKIEEKYRWARIGS